MRYLAIACLGVFLATPVLAAPEQVTPQQRKLLQKTTYDTCFRKAMMEREFAEISKARKINAAKLYCQCSSSRFANEITVDEVRDFTVLGYMPKAVDTRVRGYAESCMKEITTGK